MSVLQRTRVVRAAAPAWAVAILVLSVAPPEWLLGAAPREAWSALATAAHVAEFAVLTILLELRLPRGAGGSRRRSIPNVVVPAVLLAVVVELLQWPLPYRSFDGADLVADAVGIALGSAVSRLALGAPVGRRGAAGRPDR